MSARALLLAAVLSGASQACLRASPAVCDRAIAISTELVATDPGPAIADERAIEAVGCGGLSWIRTESGALRTVDRLGHIGRVASSFVTDLYRSSRGDLLVLRGWPDDDAPSRSVTVARYDGTGFVNLPSITLDETEAPLGIVDEDGIPVVITDTHLYVLQQVRSVRRLNPPLGEEARRGRTMTAIPKRGDIAYVGLHRGEFGGGIQAIDMRSGRVTQIRMETTASDGAIRSEVVSDPVTAIVADPSAEDCVVVSAGLQHLGRSGGRVSRICGTTMRVVLQREIGPRTMPFYGVAADDGGVWAVTTDQMFRIGLPGPAHEPLRLQTNANGIYRLSPNVIVIWRGTPRCERPLITSLE